MLICRIGLPLGLTICLAGCEPKIEYVNVVVDVPGELRQPVTVPERKAATLKDVGLILADHIEGLDIANGKIAAIDCILTEAETNTPQDCAQTKE